MAVGTRLDTKVVPGLGLWYRLGIFLSDTEIQSGVKVTATGWGNQHSKSLLWRF